MTIRQKNVVAQVCVSVAIIVANCANFVPTWSGDTANYLADEAKFNNQWISQHRWGLVWLSHLFAPGGYTKLVNVVVPFVATALLVCAALYFYHLLAKCSVVQDPVARAVASILLVLNPGTSAMLFYRMQSIQLALCLVGLVALFDLWTNRRLRSWLATILAMLVLAALGVTYQMLIVAALTVALTAGAVCGREIRRSIVVRAMWSFCSVAIVYLAAPAVLPGTSDTSYTQSSIFGLYTKNLNIANFPTKLPGLLLWCGLLVSSAVLLTIIISLIRKRTISQFLWFMAAILSPFVMLFTIGGTAMTQRLYFGSLGFALVSIVCQSRINHRSVLWPAVGFFLLAVIVIIKFHQLGHANLTWVAIAIMVALVFLCANLRVWKASGAVLCVGLVGLSVWSGVFLNQSFFANQAVVDKITHDLTAQGLTGKEVSRYEYTTVFVGSLPNNVSISTQEAWIWQGQNGSMLYSTLNGQTLLSYNYIVAMFGAAGWHIYSSGATPANAQIAPNLTAQTMPTITSGKSGFTRLISVDKNYRVIVVRLS